MDLRMSLLEAADGGASFSNEAESPCFPIAPGSRTDEE